MQSPSSTTQARITITPQLVIGLAIALAGVVLTFSPGFVASALHRPATTISEQINLRATWGGSLAGIGAFVATQTKLRPIGKMIAMLLLCTMASIAVARAVGFVLDGRPDGLQIFWIVAEIVLSAGAIAYLIRTRSRR